MTQMISYGSEMIRINSTKNHIEYSTNSGRTWHTRYTGRAQGTFIDLLAHGDEILAKTEKGLYYSTNAGKSWHRR